MILLKKDFLTLHFQDIEKVTLRKNAHGKLQATIVRFSIIILFSFLLKIIMICCRLYQL